MATKITIEIDGAPAPTFGADVNTPAGALGAPDAAGRGSSIRIHDAVAEAEASGAINAGPAPSFLDTSSSAPIASSIGGEVARVDDVASAGAAPQHGTEERASSDAPAEQSTRRGATARRRRVVR